MRACQTATLLESTETHYPEPRRVAVERRKGHAANWFGVSMTPLFGRKYISRITLAHIVEESNSAQNVSIPFNAEAIRTIQFVLGAYGLRAVRLGYHDGSSSPWLGEPDQGYFGATFGISDDVISILSDASLFSLPLEAFMLITPLQDLRVIRFGFDNHDGNECQDQILPLFAHDMKPDFGNYMRIVDMDRCRGLLDYPGWRLCQYLPLQQTGGNRVTGLSIYCDSAGLTGIVAHGKTTRLIGKRIGLPMYFHLLPGEHLTFLSLCTFPHELGPYPLVSFSSAELRCSRSEMDRS